MPRKPPDEPQILWRLHLHRAEEMKMTAALSGRVGVKAKKDEAMLPTPEQMRSGRFDIEDTHDKLPGGRQITIGKAYRRRPMIDILADQGFFTDAEIKALHHYRHCATLIERSPVRDSLNRQRYGGSGAGPTAAYITACVIVRDCESAAGSLGDILRAVVVEDISLSQWAARRHGSTEYCRVKNGRQVYTIEPRAKDVAIARLEIKIAAQRVEAELAA